MAGDDVDFFVKRRFLFELVAKREQKDDIEEKMKIILRKNGDYTVKEINNEIRACTILLLGKEHPNYYWALERLSDAGIMDGKKTLEYRAYLFKLFPNFVKMADIA